ncbi:ABC transporter ATP-binding protein [Microvirga pakistanensis]|uniref:ABC transporter ATP-binding protein n=1 Tax=Microvirga pakistanensis TaxID=1682650 RepID=UPI00106D62D2
MEDAGVLFPLRLDVDRKTYRRRGMPPLEVLRDFHLTIKDGETLCLIGPSGIGKTTILRIVMGLDRDFEGGIRPSLHKLRIGPVFQEPRLLPWRTVEENVRLALPIGERHRSLDDLFGNLRLSEWRRRYPGELSGGLARRVALARALVIDPALLVFDEPFVSLDEHAAADLRATIFDVVAQKRLSVLMVTHNIREALAVADRLVLLASRPATVIADIMIPTPRNLRSESWVETMLTKLAAAHPQTISTGRAEAQR